MSRAELHAEAERLAAEGTKPRDIAARLGLPPATVWRWLHGESAGSDREPRPAAPKAPTRDDVERRIDAVDRDFAARAERLIARYGESMWDVPVAERWRWQNRRTAAYRSAHGRDPRTAELLAETRRAMRQAQREEEE